MKNIKDLKKGDIIHVLDIIYGKYNQYVVDENIIYMEKREVYLFIHVDGVRHSDEMLRLKYTGCHSDHYILYDESKGKRLLSISTSVEKLKNIAFTFSGTLLSTSKRLKDITEMSAEDLKQKYYNFFSR